MRKPDQTSNAGNFEEVADWVAFSLATFFLAKQKKVACRRATPGICEYEAVMGNGGQQAILPYANYINLPTTLPPTQYPHASPDVDCRCDGHFQAGP
jgi:hypothetical protein